MTTLDHYDFCKPYISDNEYILWEGAPEKGFTFTSRDLVMIPFSIFWLAFALFWEFSVITSTSSLFMAIWGLPFVGVGIYLLFGRFIQSICLRNKTFYIITNKKLIIRSGSKTSSTGRGYSSDGHSPPQKWKRHHPVLAGILPQKWKEILLLFCAGKYCRCCRCAERDQPHGK